MHGVAVTKVQITTKNRKTRELILTCHIQTKFEQVVCFANFRLKGAALELITGVESWCKFLGDAGVASLLLSEEENFLPRVGVVDLLDLLEGVFLCLRL